jgi:predicted alpha/beta-hydrolase family hydrolase
MAHGAGAGMRHGFMEQVSDRLNDRGIATLRYQFPYMEQGSRRPDPPGVLHATVRAAIRRGAELMPATPLLAGGKSLGGRMTSQVMANDALPSVRGLVFLGFPLHRPGQPSTERADHLDRVSVPMLFLQGTRDSLADLGLMRTVCDRIGVRAELHVVEGGDHSFKVLKRSGRTDTAVLDELADATSHWAAALLATAPR